MSRGSSGPAHRAEQLSNHTWLVVENDPYGQYPFLYVILGTDKCVLIDTGSGISNYRDFVTNNINKKNLPYLVICTHVHFDHVGGNFRFCGSNSKGCSGICMGQGNKTFSDNYELNSLAMAHNGAKVQPFTVSRWFKDGDVLYLDDSKPQRSNSLQILFTPGHTPDSISIYSHIDKRLFVGDNIYPFTAIHLDCLGSNVKDYIASLHKMNKFIEQTRKEDREEEKKAAEAKSKAAEEKKGEEAPKTDAAAAAGGSGAGSGAGGSAAVAGSGAAAAAGAAEGGQEAKAAGGASAGGAGASASGAATAAAGTTAEKPKAAEKKAEAPKAAGHPHQEAIDRFLAIAGLSRGEADKQFSIDTLLEFCGNNAEDMVDFYLNNASDMKNLCPPKKPAATTGGSSGSGSGSGSGSSSSSSGESKVAFKQMAEAKDIVLSCGHVEGNLNPAAINELLTLMEYVSAGLMQPSNVDQGYGEYTTEKFTVCMPVKKS